MTLATVDALPVDEAVVLRHPVAPPEISILMPVYRQERWVGRAVRSVLAQRDVVADILISDDASDDATLAVAIAAVEEAGPAGHGVRVRRGQRRLIRDHVPILAREALAPVVAQAHGDDVAMPWRMRRLLDALAETGASYATSSFWTTDERGALLEGPAPERAGTRSLSDDEVFSPSPLHAGMLQAWIPGRMNFLPLLDMSYLSVSHDRLLPLRGLLSGGGVVHGSPLVLRRDHSENWSKSLVDRSSTAVAEHSWGVMRAMLGYAMVRDIDHAVACGQVGGERGRELRERAEGLRDAGIERVNRRHAELLRLGGTPTWAMP